MLVLFKHLLWQYWGSVSISLCCPARLKYCRFCLGRTTRVWFPVTLLMKHPEYWVLGKFKPLICRLKCHYYGAPFSQISLFPAQLSTEWHRHSLWTLWSKMDMFLLHPLFWPTHKCFVIHIPVVLNQGAGTH